LEMANAYCAIETWCIIVVLEPPFHVLPVPLKLPVTTSRRRQEKMSLFCGPLRKPNSGRYMVLVRAGYTLALVAVAVSSIVSPVLAQQEGVYVVQIEGEIERGLYAYLRRVLSTAEENGASAVVLDINTPGGTLDAALDIKDTVLSSGVRTIAFVNRQAFSAGALIALAADEIHMVPGSSMGAATPVSGTTGETADEKVISAVRKAFASTAEARGRDPAIAEAMVDSSVEIQGLTESGKLLTLTTVEALEWGYADGTADNLTDLLQKLGLAGQEVIQTAPSPAEVLVRFLTNSVVSSLLISLGFLGLIFEIMTAGWGIGGTVGVVCLGLFFFGHVLAGLAGWEGITLVIVGLILIAVEIFVIPGFGVAGILGILAFLGGLYMSMVGDFSSGQQLIRAGYILAASLLVMLVGTWLLLNYLPHKRSFRGLFLLESVAAVGRPAKQGQEGEDQPEPREEYSLVGSRGVALTPLRPSGIAWIGGRRIDVVTEGDWIEAGAPVEVIMDTGYRRVVQALTAEPESQAGNK